MSFKIIDDKGIKVNNWKKFYKKSSKILFDLDPVKFKEIAENQTYIYTGSILKDAVKIDDFYLYANLNIEAFLTRLRVLVKAIDLDLDEISFIIE